MLTNTHISSVIPLLWSEMENPELAAAENQLDCTIRYRVKIKIDTGKVFFKSSVIMSQVCTKLSYFLVFLDSAES